MFHRRGEWSGNPNKNEDPGYALTLPSALVSYQGPQSVSWDCKQTLHKACVLVLVSLLDEQNSNNRFS